MLIQQLAQKSFKLCTDKKNLNYKQLAEYVQDESTLEFLHQIVPKKITVKEFRKIMENPSSSSDSNSDSSESSSEEEDDNDEVVSVDDSSSTSDQGDNVISIKNTSDEDSKSSKK